MLHRLSGASARGVECISQRRPSHVPLVRCSSSVEGIFFSSRLADIGQIERLGVRMKQRYFSHRFSLFTGMLCMLICVVTLTAPTALASAGATSGVSTALAAPSASSSQPNFGPSVYIFNPSMPQSKIQATVDKVANQQVSNQFGTQRYALLFEPGTYGSSTDPLNFQVGYYTTVAGLGLSPNDVVINGSIYVHNQCFGANNSDCTALVNFWRSLLNLTINVTTPNFGCYSGEFWAVSQAAPMRRVRING